MAASERLADYLNKLERGALGGTSRRRLYCVVSNDTPYLFWYRSSDDTTTPLGRVSLLDSSFNFDPRTQNKFEVRTLEETHSFEAPTSRARLIWLRRLQHVRRVHRGIEVDSQAVTDVSPTTETSRTSVEQVSIDAERLSISSVPKSVSDVAIAGMVNKTQQNVESDRVSTCSSTFYLDEKGEPNEHSFCMPVEEDVENCGQSLAVEMLDAVMGKSPHTVETDDGVRDLEATLTKVDNQQQRNESTFHSQSLSIIPPKSRVPRLLLKLPAVLKPAKPCDGCHELLSVINNLKDRCYELHDECGANEDLVNVLRHGLVSAKQQIDSLKELYAKEDFGERIQYILERESKLTALQAECGELRQQLETLLMQCSDAEHARQRACSDLEAYKESIRTKEELILKLTEKPDYEVAIDVSENVDMQTRKSASKAKKNELGTKGEPLINELKVTDMETMRDLVVGFETQNKFLNQEVLDLQATIAKQERDNRELKRRNFAIEAKYFEQYSKYLLLLNHVKGSNLSPAQVAECLHDASTLTGINLDNLDETGSLNRTDEESSEKKATVITDNLGFYVGSKRNPTKENDAASVSGNDTLLNTAAHLQSRANELHRQEAQSRDTEYLSWLQKWDQFLVTLGDKHKQLQPNNELKTLVRMGVPHTYRARVWKSLAMYWVRNETSELGSGYYESLLKRANTKRDEDYDPLLKQIDLDLTRTLPGNALYESIDSEKVEQLRRVLYAFRYHNAKIGYCQGLNRIAAVALLYLSEADAFWLLVAVVEVLQPEDYYSQTLLGALVDQKVLADLIADKLPRVHSQLKAHEVDLSLFTLSWFITCFIDVLPHKCYLNIFDVFLLEGNKILFRFALAAMKMCEQQLLSSASSGAVHHTLSRIGDTVNTYAQMAQIAFNDLNPFPHKAIENRRAYYLQQMRKGTK